MQKLLCNATATQLKNSFLICSWLILRHLRSNFYHAAKPHCVAFCHAAYIPWHSFDTTAKYWRWLERADVIVLCIDVTVLPTDVSVVQRHTDEVTHWCYGVIVTVYPSTLVCDSFALQCYVSVLTLKIYDNFFCRIYTKFRKDFMKFVKINKIFL